MIEELLQQQRQFLNAYFDRLDAKALERIVDLLFACGGTVILSGVGKSGYIAEKVAATLLSTGTKAIFLDPGHAIHGNLGFVQEHDLFLAFSKSGESDELISLIPHVKKREALAIAIVSNEQSRLARLCDVSIALPVERELCPFDLAPTTSTAVQLLFGDCLTVALMRKKGISLDDYASNHPGGLIGKRILLKVSDLMRHGEAVPRCSLHDTLGHVLHELSAKRCGCLLIVDELMELQGIFTDGDLRRALGTYGTAALDMPMHRLMSFHPRTVGPGVLASSALRQMEEDSAKRIMMLPVVEGKRVVGLIQMHDILQAGL